MRKRAAMVFLAAVTALSQEPIFKIGTELVQVDVVVRNKSGPVAGLRKDDFTVLDNGKSQEITVFSVKSSTPSGPSLPSAAVPLPPNAVSNRVDRGGQAPGTETVILVDQKNTLKSNQVFGEPLIRRLPGISRAAVFR
jgi:VWFA-related protein